MQTLLNGRVKQIMVFHPFGQQLEPQGKLASPCAVLIKLFVKRHVSLLIVTCQYSIAPGGPALSQLLDITAFGIQDKKTWSVAPDESL